MTLDYETLSRSWDPWRFVPASYNLGVDLTASQVRLGRANKPALHWENASGKSRAYTYGELDALSSRFAGSLHRMGVRRLDRIFLRLPNVPEFYIAALGAAKLGAVFIPSSTQF